MTPSNLMFEDSSAAKADKAVPIAITSANVIDFILSNRPSAGDWPQIENITLVVAEYCFATRCYLRRRRGVPRSRWVRRAISLRQNFRRFDSEMRPLPVVRRSAIRRNFFRHERVLQVA